MQRSLSLLVVWTLFLAGVTASLGQDAQFQFGFGDIPMPERDYLAHQMTQDALESVSPQKWDLNNLTEFDARTRGWVTEAKNQGICGSCWSFAAAGTIESRILKDGGPRYDLSEQQNISCNTLMSGCCGGSGSSLMFYNNNRPMTEAVRPYAESGTSCPTQSTVTCSSIGGPTEPYLSGGFYTVDRNVAAIKTSVLTHGPSYFRYNVYSDFITHWNSGAADSVYKNNGGDPKGGHAVLIIGWSDTKSAYLLKNSWGKTGGPNGDGTFWMSYDGHLNELGIQMFNITTLTRVRDSETFVVAASESPTLVDTAIVTDKSAGGFEASPGLLESIGGGASETAATSNERDAAAGFGWYNNLRVNGSTTLTDTTGTTQVSVYAADVKWRFGFGSRAITSPKGDGGTGGSGWQFRNAHRYGITLYQGNRYWNITSRSSSSPTVISGLTNTQPVRIMVNDTVGNYSDNGGSFDLYLRKDN